jgi:hypothetical protein
MRCCQMVMGPAGTGKVRRYAELLQRWIPVLWQ